MSRFNIFKLFMGALKKGSQSNGANDKCQVTSTFIQRVTTLHCLEVHIKIISYLDSSA